MSKESRISRRCFYFLKGDNFDSNKRIMNSTDGINIKYVKMWYNNKTAQNKTKPRGKEARKERNGGEGRSGKKINPSQLICRRNKDRTSLFFKP
jgi:hypothetical protein